MSRCLFSPAGREVLLSPRSKYVLKVHVFLHFSHGIYETSWAFPHESFEEVTWQEACDQSHQFNLVRSLEDHDNLTIESHYVTMQAFLMVLLDTEQVRGRTFDLLVGY